MSELLGLGQLSLGDREDLLVDPSAHTLQRFLALEDQARVQIDVVCHPRRGVDVAGDLDHRDDRRAGWRAAIGREHRDLRSRRGHPDHLLDVVAGRLATSYWTNPETGALELYDEAAGGQWSRPPAFPSAGGGLVSTIDDYLAFGQMMLNNGMILTTKSQISERPVVPDDLPDLAGAGAGD